MYRLLKRVVISGHPGTGTTTLIEQLAKLYNLDSEQVIRVGDLFRQNSKQKTGRDITGYYQREVSEDLSIDNMQRRLLSDPNPEMIFILESRLGGFFVREIGHPPAIITISLTTDDTVRFKRVFERDRPNVTFEQYSQQIRQRQENDLKQWQEAYPQMRINPLDDPKLYDLRVDNTNLDIEQTVDAVNEKLLQLGAVEKIS